MAKKVAPVLSSSKQIAARAKLEERKWKAHLASQARATIPLGDAVGSSLDGEAARQRKKERDHEREKFRVPREEAPSGFRYAADGSVEAIDGPTVLDLKAPQREITIVDRWMAGKLGLLVDLATSSPQIPVATPVNTHRPVGRAFQMTPAGIAPLEVVSAGPESATAPAWALDGLRRAYLGFTGREPEDEWQHRLRMHVEHAMHDRQGKRVPGKSGVSRMGE